MRADFAAHIGDASYDLSLGENIFRFSGCFSPSGVSSGPNGSGRTAIIDVRIKKGMLSPRREERKERKTT
jgi:hypothetical protein